MYFDGEYRLIGKVDVAPLRAAVLALPEAAWREDTERQQVYKPHRQTQSIQLIFDPDMRHEAPTTRPAHAQFARELEPIIDTIARFYASETGEDAGYPVRALLVRLCGGGAIGSHRDHGYSLARAHRIHCPIVTNAAAEFGIAGRVRHLPAGELWEINNRKVHGVRNPGEARIHLIVDYVIPGERVFDPEDGELIA
jgi:hypothetical protein